MSKRDARRLPDFHLWTAVTETVDPLRRQKLLRMGNGPLPMPIAVSEPPATPVKAPPKRQPPRQPFLPPYQAPQPMAETPTRQVEPSIHKKVSRGRIEIDATIDLHGMTQTAARAALHRFVQSSAGRGARTLLVITGKGQKTDGDYIAAMTERGILRSMLPIWLSEPSLSPLVSGWSHAARGHGGEGAWYVRLRRP